MVSEILYDTTVGDTCHYTFVRTYGICNTKSELYCKLWTLGDNDMAV